MSSIANVLAADASLKNDVAALTALVTQLIALVQAQAAGSVTPAQLQQLLTDLQGDDTTVNSAAQAIQSVLNPPAPAAPAPTV